MNWLNEKLDFDAAYRLWIFFAGAIVGAIGYEYMPTWIYTAALIVISVYGFYFVYRQTNELKEQL